MQYVPSAQNPADQITKPQKAADFVNNSEWWNGPWWLLDKNNWPISITESELKTYQNTTQDTAKKPRPTEGTVQSIGRG